LSPSENGHGGVSGLPRGFEPDLITAADKHPDSNSARTDSYVSIRREAGKLDEFAAPKALDHNGYHWIIRPGEARRAGLKILVSAVQSRPSPP
jgi:hypothetical protein